MKKETGDIFEQGKKLPLLEDFYTLQGEGKYTGKAAYFIRIGGCDIGCKWCDTKFSWDPKIHTLTSVDSIIAKAEQYLAKTIVVTGGEPTTYNLDYLTKTFKNKGIETHLETSGVYKLTGIWDWICLSPKQHNKPLPIFYEKANELKVIIEKKKDIQWAVECKQKVKHDCELFLQPEWSRFNDIINDIVEFIKLNPEWTMSLQAHKFMHIP